MHEPLAQRSMNRGGGNPSLKIDIAYASVTLGTSVVWTILGGWLLYFYIPPKGTPLIPAALYGVAMFVIRAISAAITLPIGHLSDRTRSRWGRRLPYMAVSALPMLVFFVLLWSPPVQGESVWNLVYLLVIMALYNLAYALNQVPYMALVPELALTEKHRVRLSAWTSGFLLIGMILGGLAGPLIAGLGYAAAAVIYAVGLLPFFYVPLFVLREPSHQSPTAARLNLREGITLMMRNKPFLVMTATGVFYWGITTLTQSIIPYVVTEICLLSESDTWYFYIPAILASLACYPLVMWLANRWGKWIVFAGSLLASAIVLPSLMLIGEWLPLSLMVQGIVWITVQAVAFSGVAMLPPAFGAEIVDHDEELTGERREGIYYATWGVLDQVINGVIAAVLPLLLLLGRSRTDPNGPLGVRMVGVVGGVLLLVGFLIFGRYPLKRTPPARGIAQEAS
jgi:GPH family glycoside/pentoside/hexuronide:cation symporter